MEVGWKRVYYAVVVVPSWFPSPLNPPKQPSEPPENGMPEKEVVDEGKEVPKALGQAFVPKLLGSCWPVQRALGN